MINPNVVFKMIFYVVGWSVLIFIFLLNVKYGG
jgi:hypothetical protein